VSILDAVNRRIGCGPKVRNFLAVLISHERLAALNEITEEFRLEMNRRLSISDAEVVTARPLQDQERAKLEREVAELAGMRVNATFRQDKSLIGGAIVRIGSTIYDGSVRGRLERLKERLAAN
jgi:F-type H+-transporting ATPase subunit delta